MGKILIKTFAPLSVIAMLPLLAVAQSDAAAFSKEDIAISQVAAEAIAAIDEQELLKKRKKQTAQPVEQLEATNEKTTQESNVAAYSVLLDYYQSGESQKTLGYSVLSPNQVQAVAKKETSLKEEPKEEAEESSKQ